jgi:hypothetical protein
VLECGDFTERMSRLALSRRATRCENIDRDKFVPNAFFFQSKPDSTHIDAVRSTEDD